MKKIPSLFVRDWAGDRTHVLPVVDPACAWVLAGGLGVRATRKWDGTACRILGGRFWKRFDAKRGKAAPAGFEPAQDPDPETGHWPGWILVGDGPADVWHRDVMTDAVGLSDGTYELCGPKIQGNPERLDQHVLIPHGRETLDLDVSGRDPEAAFVLVMEFLVWTPVEGVVWWHADGRLAKAKARDFGIAWPPRLDSAPSGR